MEDEPNGHGSYGCHGYGGDDGCKQRPDVTGELSLSCVYGDNSVSTAEVRTKVPTMKIAMRFNRLRV